MKNVLLHLRKADYQMRRAIAGLQGQENMGLVENVGHAIATLRDVKRILEAADTLKRSRDQESTASGEGQNG